MGMMQQQPQQGMMQQQQQPMGMMVCILLCSFASNRLSFVTHSMLRLFV
jgi:hypothetical protein